MGIPQFGDPRPHIPSDMGTGGEHDHYRDMGAWGPKNSGDMGIRRWFRDPRFLFYTQFEKTCKNKLYVQEQEYVYAIVHTSKEQQYYQ